jgi:cell division protein FtsI/penicillin-binding protein 2
LKSNIAQQELTAMREASKTGGALGNVSDKEGERLASSLGALDVTQSPEAFKKQLQIVKDNIYRWNAQALSIQNDFDYKAAKDEGYSDEQIFNFLNK